MLTCVFSFEWVYICVYCYQTRTVQVGHVSDLATEREIHEFFSFSGEIEHIEIRKYGFLAYPFANLA